MLQSLIENYGYLAVFIGAFLEGETILVMAGRVVRGLARGCGYYPFNHQEKRLSPGSIGDGLSGSLSSAGDQSRDIV
jgi:hypothetical protein